MPTGPVLLVVEDEPLLLLATADTLTTGGYAVIEVGDGRSALAVIDDSTKIDGVVTDIRIGAGPDGWEVARHARNSYPSIAVVYMTGDSVADWPAEGVPDSIVLQKPFADAQLLTAISGLINNQ